MDYSLRMPGMKLGDLHMQGICSTSWATSLVQIKDLPWVISENTFSWACYQQLTFWNALHYTHPTCQLSTSKNTGTSTSRDKDLMCSNHESEWQPTGLLHLLSDPSRGIYEQSSLLSAELKVTVLLHEQDLVWGQRETNLYFSLLLFALKLQHGSRWLRSPLTLLFLQQSRSP